MPTWSASRKSSRDARRRRTTPRRTDTSSFPPGAPRAAQADPVPCRRRPPTLPSGKAVLRRSASANRPADDGAFLRRRR
eukprot:2347188-Rhodomonas_salina.1